MLAPQGLPFLIQGAGLIGVQYISLLCFLAFIATLSKKPTRRRDAKEVLGILMLRRRGK